MDEVQEKLLQIYGIERVDDQQAFAQALVLLGFAVSYVTALAAFLGEHYHSAGYGPNVPEALPLLAPAVPMAILGIFVTNLAGMAKRTKYLMRLEAALEVRVNSAEYPDHIVVPSFRREGDFVNDIFKAGSLGVITVLNYAAYVFSYAVIGIFTYFSLAPGRWDWWHIATATGYVAMFVAAIVGVFMCAFHPGLRP